MPKTHLKTKNKARGVEGIAAVRLKYFCEFYTDSGYKVAKNGSKDETSAVQSLLDNWKAPYGIIDIQGDNLFFLLIKIQLINRQR